jgi:hypothetical protein
LDRQLVVGYIASIFSVFKGVSKDDGRVGHGQLLSRDLFLRPLLYVYHLIFRLTLSPWIWEIYPLLVVFEVFKVICHLWLVVCKGIVYFLVLLELSLLFLSQLVRVDT